MSWLGWAALAWVAWLVVGRLNDILAAQEALMAQIDDAVDAANAKVDALIAKVDETVTTLGELKALVEQGQTGDAVAALAAIGTKIDEATARLTSAEDAADPTPDTPTE